MSQYKSKRHVPREQGHQLHPVTLDGQAVFYVDIDELFHCQNCGSRGFLPSNKTRGKCTFCDGTEAKK